MLIWGGMNGQARLCDGAAFDPADNRWAPMAPAPAAVCASVPRVVTAAQGKLVVLADASPTSIVAATYDPLTNHWALADPRGAPRAAESAATLPNGALYISEPSLPPHSDRQSIYEFDASSGRWRKRGEACVGRLMRLGEDLLQLGGTSPTNGCLLEPAVGRCTELAMFQWRWAVPVISIADGVLLRFGAANPGSPDVVTLLRRQGSGRVSSRVKRDGNVRGIAQLLVEPWGGAYRRVPVESFFSPAATKRLLVRRGARNTASKPVAEVATDELGLFGFDLPPGAYCLIDEAKMSAPPPGLPHFEPKCLKDAWRSCDASFRVPESPRAVVVVHVRFTQGKPACYVGPGPP